MRTPEFSRVFPTFICGFALETIFLACCCYPGFMQSIIYSPQAIGYFWVYVLCGKSVILRIVLELLTGLIFWGGLLFFLKHFWFVAREKTTDCHDFPGLRNVVCLSALLAVLRIFLWQFATENIYAVLLQTICLISTFALFVAMYNVLLPQMRVQRKFSDVECVESKPKPVVFGLAITICALVMSIGFSVVSACMGDYLFDMAIIKMGANHMSAGTFYAILSRMITESPTFISFIVIQLLLCMAVSYLFVLPEAIMHKLRLFQQRWRSVHLLYKATIYAVCTETILLAISTAMQIWTHTPHYPIMGLDLYSSELQMPGIRIAGILFDSESQRFGSFIAMTSIQFIFWWTVGLIIWGSSHFLIGRAASKK